MTYHRRNKNIINKKAVVVIVVLVVLFFFGPSVKSTIQWFSNPIISTKNAIVTPFKTSAEYFKFKQKLVDENENLKNENRRLEIENLTVESLKEENKSLREIVNFQENTSDLIVAKVISQPPFSPYDTFVLNLGKTEVFVSNKVYYSGVLIGEIEEVYGGTAVVRLYSSPEKTLFVNISGNETEATGLGGAGFILTLPKDIDISENETVFVGDSPIGRVDSIESDQSGAFQNIYFRYPFNINDVDFVQVSQQKN